MSATSQNNYPANDISLTQSYKIPGTSRAIRLRKGPAGELLVAFAAWFDKHVEDIDAGQLDDWGYAERPIRGSTTTLSNHASGTAMDLNATKHPLGERGTFTAKQAATIRAELKVYHGCIRWGGDYVNRADEMHFEIVKSESECRAVLAALKAEPSKPTPPKTVTPPEEGNPLADLSDTDIAKLADAFGKQIQKYTVADNNYDSQRAAYEAVANAEAAHVLAGGTPHTADELKAAQSAVWSYLRPLWGAK